MLRDHPLTWLFVIASICVDLVFVMTERGDDLSAFRFGMVLGQLAAVAIWTSRTQLHRLAKVSILTAVVGLLANIRVDAAPISIWLAFDVLYVSAIAVATSLSDSIHDKRRFQSGMDRKRWQISLVECMGWLTLASILSFGARHMDYSFLSPEVIDEVLATLAVPIVLAILTRRDLRDVRRAGALIVLTVLIAAAAWLASEQQNGGYVVFIQFAYLVCWLTTLSMDNSIVESQELRRSLIRASANAEPPRLFNPQD